MNPSTASCLAAIPLVLSTTASAQYKTSEFSYITPSAEGSYTYEPLVTVGDLVPLSGGAPGDQFAFAGIPDAMGIYKDRVTKDNILFVAHELPGGVQTTPLPGEVPYLGAYVSRFLLDGSGGIIGGGLAHDELFAEDTPIGSAPRAGDGSAFTRFCSGSFAGRREGMDRPIFLTNEESSGGTFDAAGALAVAVFDGEMHTLPALGRVARETTLVMPRRDRYSVVISSEDSTPGYVYMYVGTKSRRGTALEKNGFTDGKVYVLAGEGSDAWKNAGTFTSGTIATQWIEIPGAAELDSNGLRAASLQAGGFIFIRVEDIEFTRSNPTGELIVAATGGGDANRLGRLYKVNFDRRDPRRSGSMEVLYNGDTFVTPGGTYENVALTDPTVSNGGVTDDNYAVADLAAALAAGQDGPVSVDNIAINGSVILMQEDRNGPADAVFTFHQRNGGLWTFDIATGNVVNQGQFNFDDVETRDGMGAGTLTAGRWESSGAIATDEIFGRGTFVINVQAHDQGSIPSSNRWRSNAPDPSNPGSSLSSEEYGAAYNEDGQVLIMRPVRR